MNNINLWSKRNNLSLNAKKTKMTFFSTSQLSQRHDLSSVITDFQSGDQKIEKVNNFKVLGIRFNEHLDWTEHINSIARCCYATLRTLKLFKNIASYYQRKTLAEALILSKINYGNILLSDAPKYQLNRLQKVQNAAAGFVLKRHAAIKDVIKLNWLPIVESIDLSLAKAAHNAIHNVNWPSYIKLTRLHSNRTSRSSETSAYDIDDRTRLNGSFKHESAKCFNDLPLDIKKIESKQSFGVKCRNYFIDKATARLLNMS